MIGATLLHDIGMHLRESGFRELDRQDSRFQPLAWFRDTHEGYLADRPWHKLWGEYVREARRFSDRQLTDIIGEESARALPPGFHRHWWGAGLAAGPWALPSESV